MLPPPDNPDTITDTTTTTTTTSPLPLTTDNAITTTTKNHNNQHHNHPRKPKPTLLNPLQKGITTYLTHHHNSNSNNDTTLPISSLPKRFTIYAPLLLLPVNALTTPPAWHTLYSTLTPTQKTTLYECILAAFSRYKLTHIAMNAPIALTDAQGTENRMRSPGGLLPLHGDFGPAPSTILNLDSPTPEDLGRAFWVSTVQNHGIEQIWAPMYTMFSRGNVTEKARILGEEGMEGLRGEDIEGQGQGISVVDMYAGIGYFVFSYLRRGVRRVWGWEINGWSVEGLRRGCVANGWGCRVVRVGEDGVLEGGMGVEELVDGLRDGEDGDKVVVFHGDNRFAARVLAQIRDVMQVRGRWAPVRHVNLGLLPSSEAAWGDACRMVDGRLGGWLHVHENVDVRRIEEMRDRVTSEIGRLRGEALKVEGEVVAECRHVEQVKTYAPGVMHCVFDVKVPALEL
ncbi:tRNA(Phe) (4-demethylwyosine(37)-C(7)) aminocarboxypropyltransferase [Aspergillus vadensis CBS 113365]|uniref:tRNA wybutosine-synthesizing protein 2 n=1 Tax=Aspergillus vadensis (strain CBS 113365 / IMI 142717 / IBT 24658) TaxID=1448311 RepID=A0A319BIA3_ASPVC|nr:tRNA wybutosine-synthesizing protein 2 [Aspergillus vadensis CBS 113365]PYH71669.1 tRNA wybutosine-synthesizing protein 2 [Aspergillus vadensis CBS 113365]